MIGYFKKRRILKLAEMSGCDIDGDIVYYKGKSYYVNAFNREVKGEDNRILKKFTGRFPV